MSSRIFWGDKNNQISFHFNADGYHRNVLIGNSFEICININGRETPRKHVFPLVFCLKYITFCLYMCAPRSVAICLELLIPTGHWLHGASKKLMKASILVIFRKSWIRIVRQERSSVEKAFDQFFNTESFSSYPSYKNGSNFRVCK